MERILINNYPKNINLVSFHSSDFLAEGIFLLFGITPQEGFVELSSGVFVEVWQYQV